MGNCRGAAKASTWPLQTARVLQGWQGATGVPCHAHKRDAVGNDGLSLISEDWGKIEPVIKWFLVKEVMLLFKPNPKQNSQGCEEAGGAGGNPLLGQMCTQWVKWVTLGWTSLSFVLPRITLHVCNCVSSFLFFWLFGVLGGFFMFVFKFWGRRQGD